MEVLHVIPTEDDSILFRREDGTPAAFSVSPDPADGEYVLLDSVVSGGDFSQFLQNAMERYHGRVCLYLRPVTAAFSLPCPDGQGNEEVQAVEGGTFSPSLCTNWIPGDPWILYDDENSLREKSRLAEAAGIPYLAVEPSHLRKRKAP